MKFLSLFILMIVGIASCHEITKPLQEGCNICENGGQLQEDVTCKCLLHYTGDRCDRLKKSQTTTFLLAFFFNEFGAANFYLENYKTAQLEAFFGTLFFIMVLVLDYRAIFLHKPYSKTLWYLKITFFVPLFINWIYTWRSALNGTLRDGHGDRMLYDLVWSLKSC